MTLSIIVQILLQRHGRNIRIHHPLGANACGRIAITIWIVVEVPLLVRMFIEWPSASSAALQLITPVDPGIAVAFEQPGPCNLLEQHRSTKCVRPSNSHCFC